MNGRLILSLIIGKIIFFLSKYLKIGGGSAAPGLYALKINPNLILDLTKKIPQTVVITGTNGKTTTTRMLAHFARNQGLKVIHNRTGSNLERGIASTLISSLHLPSTKLSCDLAIWELDEAAFNMVVPKVKPDIIVCLNAFRDQLDRYGEVDSIIKKWGQTLKNIDNNTKIFLNGDDQNLLQLKKYFPGSTQTFGIEGSKIIGEKIVRELKKEQLSWKAKGISHQGVEKTSFEVTNGQENVNISLPLPGIYNIYNFLAAYICAKTLRISNTTITSALEKFSPAFGRVEKLLFPKAKEGYIFLIKNPTGATEVFKTIKDEIKAGDRLLLALNDNLADGTDVSWIWDSRFEELSIKNKELNIICAGVRVDDLALRLKYAGFQAQQLNVESNLTKALEQSLEGLEGRLFILPTYTALLSLQKTLAEAGIKKHYWNEES